MKEKEESSEQFEKLVDAVDPLPVEVVEGTKLKLRLQEAEEQYKIAYVKFIDLFDIAWDEVLSERHEKSGEAAAGDNAALHSLFKSDLVERGFKLFIEHDPSQRKSLFLQKWFWKKIIEHELDLFLKNERSARNTA
jgi:hypothetical protein